MKNLITRLFKIITIEQALKLKLTHVTNIHGDPINWFNCRSLWKDSKGRLYRVKHLYYTPEPQLGDHLGKY